MKWMVKQQRTCPACGSTDYGENEGENEGVRNLFRREKVPDVLCRKPPGKLNPT
jgi:predicted nucleic-acid-binding Zn-ribbon protein